MNKEKTEVLRSEAQMPYLSTSQEVMRNAPSRGAKVGAVAKGSLDGPSSSVESAVSADSSEIHQFEVELCWCIQQLERVLSTQKINSKQAIDTTHTLNILKSKKAPIIKKRQAMRTAFGDYRAKMLEEEKKFKVKHRMKIDSQSPSKKSRFLKQSASSSVVVKCQELEPSDNSFRFNFNELQLENSNEENSDKVGNDVGNDEFQTQQKSDVQKENPQTSFKYQPSDNSFRFNFETEH